MMRLTPRWSAYLSEATALGLFMISAAAATVAIEHPGSLIRQALDHDVARRALMGLCMGATAAAIIYSPLGRLSGPHMNPAVTLTFLGLGKVAPDMAAGYVVAQVVGGLTGLGIAAVLLSGWIAHPTVNFVATTPGMWGVGTAFAAEAIISFLMMSVVLTLSNHERLARYTGVGAAGLVALFITVEAPLSGMSMNPARSLAPSVVGDLWTHLWIYFVAPPLGMLLAASAYVWLRGRHAVLCAKLHYNHANCVFGCGPTPVPDVTAPAQAVAARV